MKEQQSWLSVFVAYLTFPSSNYRHQPSPPPPSIETHLAVVRGLPTKKFIQVCQREELN